MAVRVPGESAACAAANPDLFFPSSSSPAAEQPAKDYCRRCPLLRPCLRWSLTHNELGIWGGTNEDERASLKRRIAQSQSLNGVSA